MSSAVCVDDEGVDRAGSEVMATGRGALTLTYATSKGQVASFELHRGEGPGATLDSA